MSDMNTSKRISVVIFDCDGVMFDSRQANINFYNHLLKQFGLPPMSEDSVPFVHMHTADESVRHLFRGTPYMEQAQVFRMQMDYGPFIKDMILEPGLEELLKVLKPQFGLAVATNRSNTIEPVLESFGLKGYFDLVISSLDVKKPKPHPESIFKILDHFKVTPQNVFYVGDSAIDDETAKASGVHFISYKNRDLEADYHVDVLLDIVRLVGSDL
jgi:HAD superfamily hydrolase (TIGR01509 family)